MANPTTNFGWVMPTSTSLVTNLPADFNTFGQAVDTSMAQLKGGTTGQILSKTSATDMAFTWITNDVGDITAVNTTAPLAGGGTSGALTLSIAAATTSVAGAVQLSDSTSTTSSVLAATPTAVKSAYDLANGAIPKSLIDAAGDLVVGTAADTAGRLGIGSAGQVLKVNSGATALEWGAAGSGKVLQVVSTTTSGETSSSTNASFTDYITLAITPNVATSKVLVMASVGGASKSDGNSQNQLEVRVVRDSTAIFDPAAGLYTNTALRETAQFGISYLDSPATTSSITYKIQFKNGSNSASVSLGALGQKTSLILMEIGA